MNLWRAKLTGIVPPMTEDEAMGFNTDWPPSARALEDATRSAFEMGYGIDIYRPDDTHKRTEP